MTGQFGELGEAHSRYIRLSVCLTSSVKGREIGGFLPVKTLVHAKSTSRVYPAFIMKAPIKRNADAFRCRFELTDRNVRFPRMTRAFNITFRIYYHHHHTH